MAKKSKSKPGIEPLSQSGSKGEVITVRMSPKLKYGLELLARKQHRAVSSVVTWAIERMMTFHEDGLFKVTKNPKRNSIPNEEYMLDMLWDVDPADRLVKLATHWPEMMTYEDEIKVRAIKEKGWGWPEKGDSATKAMRGMFPDIVQDPGGNWLWIGDFPEEF